MKPSYSLIINKIFSEGFGEGYKKAVENFDFKAYEKYKLEKLKTLGHLIYLAGKTNENK